jgi:uncharacterized protein (DUF2267 family)
MAVMSYERFITTVQRDAEIPGDEAQRAACATLQTLGERISSGEARDIAERLPEELGSCLSPAGHRDTFDINEFLHRVAARAEIDEPAAQRDARAVFGALFRTVGPEEFHDMRSELPKDFDPLLAEALRESSTLAPGESEPTPGISLDEFIGRVADRADTPRDAAQRAAEAVLEVLGIRITGGEAEDLAARLPSELGVALMRGVTAAGSEAKKLSADEFLKEIARREDVSADEAADHVRAVLTTLREAVGEKEFQDTVAQLPDDYRPLLRFQG